MSKPLLACGHVANGVRTIMNGDPLEAAGIPCCVICSCVEPAKEAPNLENRRAKCPDCGRTTASNLDLAFFEVRPKDEFDRYYCGCRGWD
jgi:hypothetical protein